MAGFAQSLATSGRRSLPAALLGGGLLALIAVLVAPAWAQGLRTATTVDVNAVHRPSLEQVRATVPPRTDRVLVDDTYYVDLVEAGFGAVRFYKMDLAAGLDPSVVRRLPSAGGLLYRSDRPGSARRRPRPRQRSRLGAQLGLLTGMQRPRLRTAAVR